MEKEQIINYVMNTPGNTNAEVLRGMLNQLNNSGGGGGDGVFVINATLNEETGYITLDKTAGEIMEEMNSGHVAFVRIVTGSEEAGTAIRSLPVSAAAAIDQGFVFVVGNDTTFTAASEDDYPTSDGSGNDDSGGGGLTLYGPYMATIHAATSINANDISNISLSDLYNVSRQLVDMSQLTQDTKFFFSGFHCFNKNLSVLGASTPNEMNGPFTIISCANNTGSPISVNIGDVLVVLYCSIELPPASPIG